MLYVFVNVLNYIMFIFVMVVSCGIVSYITCMLHFLCKLITIIKNHKFMYFSYIYITISVYGIMFINNNTIGKHMVRLF